MAKIAVVLAIYEPNEAFLWAQLSSIQSQTHQDFICICILDGTFPPCITDFQKRLSDSRFIFIPTKRHLGVFGAFMFGIKQVPQDALYIAFSDQDDVWHSNKLGTLVQFIEQKKATLVYSDARLINASEQLIAPSFRRYHWRTLEMDLAQTLLNNKICGMSMLFSRKILAYVGNLPYKIPSTAIYHDGWVALHALMLGGVCYLDTPLLDYRAHSYNVSGKKGRLFLILGVLMDLIQILKRPFKIKRCIAVYALRISLFRTIKRRLPRHVENIEESIYFAHKGWLGFYLKKLLKALLSFNLRNVKTLLSMVCAKCYLAMPFIRRYARRYYRNSSQIIKKLKIGV